MKSSDAMSTTKSLEATGIFLSISPVVKQMDVDAITGDRQFIWIFNQVTSGYKTASHPVISY